jgi:hypothetical protein
MNQFAILLGALLTAIPIIGITVVAIILGVRRRSIHPRASALVGFGLVLLVVKTIGTELAQIYLRTHAAEYGDAASFASHLTVVNILSYGLNIAGIALVTAAVFSNRDMGQGTV